MGLDTYGIGDTFTPGRWNADYVLRQGECKYEVNELTPHRAVAHADRLFYATGTDVLVQTQIARGEKMKTIARRVGRTWEWKKLKPSGDVWVIALGDFGSMSFKADSLVTAKTTAKAITKLFSLHGACYLWHNGDKVSMLQGHMWQDQQDSPDATS